MKTVAVIPSRYASTRLPGKALKDICGKPMVWWVYQHAILAKGIDEVYVATDDKRIADVCKDFDIPYIMTKDTHQVAATRLQELSETITADFYIQINGDEPLVEPELIEKAVPQNVLLNEEFGTNIIMPIHNPTHVIDPSNIKMVFDKNMFAKYMSRTPIPYPFKNIDFNYYKHVGIIGYNKKMLDFYENSSPGRFEIIEGIDTLRFIDYGKKLLCIEAPAVECLSVDTEKDLVFVRQTVQKKIDEGKINSSILEKLGK